MRTRSPVILGVLTLTAAALLSPASASPASASPASASPATAEARGGEADIVTSTQILAAAPITRSEVLVRAASWTGVPYSQSSYHPTPYGTFRQDCSGYVSMTWGLPGRPADPNGGTNTVGLTQISTLIGKEDLKPGDALIDAAGTNQTRHVILFERWANAEHTRMWAYQQQGPDGHLGADHGIVNYPGGEYRPYRYNRIVDDNAPPTRPTPFAADQGVVYYPRSDGTLEWYRHNGSTTGSAVWAPNSRTVVGAGWANFSNAFSGGDGVIYAIQRDGTLLWYRHDGYLTGASTWAANSGTVVGTGWNRFTSVFSMGNGIIYGVQADGVLVWFNHLGHRTGAGVWADNSGAGVGTAWQRFTRVFTTGDGIIYAVDTAGTLFWYNHYGYLTGVASWSDNTGAAVGSSWAGFSRVFATSGGVIYAVTTDGTLLWYNHRGYQSGTATWADNSGAIIGSGWNS